MYSAAFANRLKIGNDWSLKVFRIIESFGWTVLPFGAENVASEVHRTLSSMKAPDSTAKFLRYLPDGFALNKEKEEAFFFDAKLGRTIEKDAYFTYVAFAGKDRRVILFIKYKSDIYRIPIHKLVFVDSEKLFKNYDESSRMPIDEDGWIAPRLWPQDKYFAWKKKYPNASGTSYRYLDLPSCRKYLLKTPTNAATLAGAR